MESGSTAEIIDGKPVFIFKRLSEDIALLSRCKEVALNIETVQRPEFPTTRFNFEFAVTDESVRSMDYFFALDSVEEKALLTKIWQDGAFYILFLDKHGEAYLKKVRFTGRESELIGEAIRESEAVLRDPEL